jgi:exodeoxyribonuclease III
MQIAAQPFHRTRLRHGGLKFGRVPQMSLSLCLLLLFSAMRAGACQSTEVQLVSFLGEPQFKIQQVFTQHRFPNVVVAIDGTVLAMARFNLSWILAGDKNGDGELPGWLPATAGRSETAATTDTVRVMTYNLWIGGEAGGQPLTQSALVIQAAQADVVGIQESSGEQRSDGSRPDNAAEIARMLGWHHVDQGGGRAVLSRFPITELTPGRHGAIVVLPSGRPLHVFNVHLPASPYQPYQLLRIPYGNAPFLDTVEELVAAAHKARGDGVTALLQELSPRIKAGDAVVLTGDFNEPSHEDWIPAAVEAGLAPLAVPYPTTQRILEAGMVDAYRGVHPNPVSHPGWTWTPITSEDDPNDRHDRIDMIFTGPGIVTASTAIVGERFERANIVVRPYPSDHRALVIKVLIAAK